MAEKLTPEQALAVTNRGGNLLVSAAAGSGKTKVLVDRLLSYLTDPTGPADLDEFLIITYTRAAAAELRMKIADKLTDRIVLDPENKRLQKQLQLLYLTKISTVHGFCGDLLREYAYRLGLDGDFRVADESAAGELQQQETHVLLQDGSALAETTYLPQVCGVAVLCEGGGDVRIAARITELLHSLLDLPTNRICVEQRKR